MTTQDKIRKVGQEIIDLLIEKNESYGDSALVPANIFASGDAVANLTSRIDDKLMRVKAQGVNGFGEDNVKDLIGYLILLKIALDDKSNVDWKEQILEKEGFYETNTKR